MYKKEAQDQGSIPDLPIMISEIGYLMFPSRDMTKWT